MSRVCLLALFALLQCARVSEGEKNDPPDFRTTFVTNLEGGVDCEAFENECKELLLCDFGVEKITGADRCERCKCKQNPCNMTSCAVGERCVLQKAMSLKSPLKENLLSAECVPTVKAGACPMEQTSPLNDTCPRECADDADCRGVGKCCRRGCSHLCLQPVQQSNLHFSLFALAFGTDKIADKDIVDPVRMHVRIAGDKNATVIGELGKPLRVRCLASGYPPPSVYWYRDSVAAEVLNNDAVYEAKDNVLLIRHLSINILGPYTCRAYNGAGAPASWVVTVQAYKPPGLFIYNEWLVPRDPEVTFTTAVADETSRASSTDLLPVGNVGDEKTKTTGKLGQPLYVRCQVSEYPPPAVSWFFGFKLLNNDTVYEVTGNVLLIKSLAINSLGEYSCKANNRDGKAVSRSFLVHAYNPGGLFYENKFLVSSTTVAPIPSTRSSTSTTKDTTTITITASTTPISTHLAPTTVETTAKMEVTITTEAPTPVPPSSKRPRTCKDKDSIYGCCPDGVSPAQGPNYEGCPVEPCADTLFGCCASDNKTAAQGNDQEGCPPPSPPCASSEYGCCADNETEATGPEQQGCPETASGLNNEGCPGLCSTTPHGCCQDGKTPAHGPEFEGCCLLQAFGCCPDNRKPAEGPHLDGCGCQYALHGCCPDNITIAQGPDNLGCGCQYTQHGCCPDRLTAASGPKNEGCPCNTYQFGCCVDGVTIAKGPDQQGCHCRESKFGCCGDGETPATGPNSAGCDCSSSKYGCCPDGRTEAAGPRFLGCTDAPENKQAACSMTKDTGPCLNLTSMWYYDLVYGSCSRFWYGGCDGNGNRFTTREECKDVCLQPSPKDACKLPSVKGACDADYQRWHYNSTREQCIIFRYGGCLGNANNFESRELCQKQCEPSSVTGQCDLPIDQGSCAGNFSRWGFNSEAHRCEQFIWGGCEGNSNRFSSEAACQLRCAGTQPPQCTQPQEAGNCTEKEALWSFSQSENRCLPFYYSGCGGNDNRFASREACEQTCPSAYVPDKCTLPYKIGKCSNYRERWFYDTTYKRCRQFYYGGCDGNENNFATEAECQSSCSEVKTTTTTTTTITTTTARPEEPQPQTQAPDRSELMVPDKCTDDHFFGNCDIIVLSKMCRLNDYSKFCCKSCVEAGQIDPQEVELAADGALAKSNGDPVRMPVGIAGDENAVVTGELGQPLYVRCLAYGYPPPTVFWYHGYGGPMVPPKDAVYETRGNVLLIRSLAIETLGEYTCQAYNGEGKAASWVVLVRAYMPDGLFIGHEFLVSRDNLRPRPNTKPPTIAETTTTITTTTTEAPRPLFTVPVSTHVSTPFSTLNIGADLRLTCEVDGFPEPDVYWTKDGANIQTDGRITITGSTIVSRLTVTRVTVADSGLYACHASNAYSSQSDTAQINVQQLIVPANCTDNDFFANCDVIVRFNFCRHKYYSKFCCKSCVEAGQLNPQEAEIQADQPLKK